MSKLINTNENCKRILAKPVVNNNIIDKIEFPNLLDCKTTLFGIKSKCSSVNGTTIYGVG